MAPAEETAAEETATPWRGESYERFLQYCRNERNFSDRTVRAYGKDLDRLGEFTWTTGSQEEIDQLQEEDLQRYLAWLRKQELAESTIERHIASLRAFYQFLVDRELRDDNPSSDLTFRDRGRSLPTVWSEREIESFLDVLDSKRDRALFELLYSTGMRVSELTDLNWGDYSPGERTVQVTGKGGKERIVPLGPKAAECLSEYRKTVEDEPQSPIFRNRRGDRLTSRGVRYLVDTYQPQCPVSKPLSPHVFRHSCATHMLNRGANLKTVQALLGHESLSTTQVYTHVSTDQLKKVYDDAHPRAYETDSE
jgi:integrase/recombinase XerD